MPVTGTTAPAATGTCAPAEREPYARLEFPAMGTACRVDFAAPTGAAANEFRTEAETWVRGFEARFSRFREDSLVSRINRAAGREWVPIDKEAESLFALCDWFHWVTRGVFDPSALPLLRLWDYRAAQPQVPGDTAVREALARVGWRRVQRAPGRMFLPEPGMAIDLGGIAKEYAVDRVFEMARARGLRHVLVNFGHDLRVGGEPPEGGPWRIGLEDPREPGQCWGGLALTERAVTTSGNYLRYFEAGGRRYGHIVDPRTGYPADNGCTSASAIAPTCTEAGILSTAALILGGDDGLRLLESNPATQGCLWIGDRRLETSGFLHYLVTKGATR